MSSDRPSDAPSPLPEPMAAAPEELATIVRARGAPLIEAVERHLPGAAEHAEGDRLLRVRRRGRARLRPRSAASSPVRRRSCTRSASSTCRRRWRRSLPRSATPPRRPRSTAHYEAGYRLARGAGIPEQVCGWLLRQRERFDGSGPEGLEGERIPVEARLIRAACICQTALAATDPGDDRPALERAHAALAAAAGSELDPQVVAALSAVLGRAGSG